MVRAFTWRVELEFSHAPITISVFYPMPINVKSTITEAGTESGPFFALISIPATEL